MTDFFLIDRVQPATTHTEGVDAVIGEAIDDAARASHAYYEKAVTASVDASTVSDTQSSEYRRFLRAGFIKFTGTFGGSPAQITYTIPAVEKLFHFWNATNTDVKVQIGSSGYTVRAGLCFQLYATGSTVMRLSDPNVMQYTAVGSMDGAADWLWMWRDSSKSFIRVLGNDLGLGGGDGGSPPVFRGALVYSSTNFTIPSSSTAAALSWDTEAYDTDGFWSVGAPTRFTVPAGVTKVKLRACLHWDTTNSTSYRRMVFTKNGASVLGNGSQLFRPNTDPIVKIIPTETPAIECVAGDYFELAVAHTTGADRTISANSGYTTWASIQVMES